jgi:uncharacterized protein
VPAGRVAVERSGAHYTAIDRLNAGALYSPKFGRPMKQRTKFLFASGLVALTLSRASAIDQVTDGETAYESGDYESAFRLWRPLARNGDATAQNGIGNLYWNGQGVPQDDALAMVWYRKAAGQGYAVAQKNVGWLYEHRRGVPQDFAEAVSWYQKAADQGNVDAQTDLGVMYAKGQGVPQDFGRAAVLFSKAADQGNINGEFSLGLLYEKGQGVEKDYEQALAWSQKAAEQGNADAQFTLGLMYARGEGVPIDFQLAHKWFGLASRRSLDADLRTAAAKNRDIAATMLTAAQIAEAQRMESEWKPKR